MSPIIAAVLAVLIPFAASFIAREVALAQNWLGAQSALVQGIAGVVIGYLGSLLSQAIGVSLPGSLAGFDQNVISAILTAVVALLTHTSAQRALKRANG